MILSVPGNLCNKWPKNISTKYTIISQQYLFSKKNLKNYKNVNVPNKVLLPSKCVAHLGGTHDKHNVIIYLVKINKLNNIIISLVFYIPILLCQLIVFHSIDF